jgi:multidrug efflux pump subunit AcrA (membrane-fusion protein)
MTKISTRFALAPLFLCLLFLAYPAAVNAAPNTAKKKGVTKFQGKAYCRHTATVANKVDGVLEELLVSIGDSVNPDDVIAKIKIDKIEHLKMTEEVQIQRLLNNLDLRIVQYEAELQQLQAKKDEQQLLISDEMAAPATLDLLVQREKTLKKQLEHAKNEILETKRERSIKIKVLSDRLGQEIKGEHIPDMEFVLSPTAGTIIDIDPAVRPGEKILMKTTMVTIGAMDVMVIRSEIFEFEASRLTVGDTATVTLKHNDETFPATVTKIAWTPVGKRLQDPSYYEVELEVENKNFAIKEGYKVEVVFDSIQ